MAIERREKENTPFINHQSQEVINKKWDNRVQYTVIPGINEESEGNSQRETDETPASNGWPRQGQWYPLGFNLSQSKFKDHPGTSNDDEVIGEQGIKGASETTWYSPIEQALYVTQSFVDDPVVEKLWSYDRNHENGIGSTRSCFNMAQKENQVASRPAPCSAEVMTSLWGIYQSTVSLGTKRSSVTLCKRAVVSVEFIKYLYKEAVINTEGDRYKMGQAV
ncbi:hypothetical protein DFH07DRAFT_785697 [Mycena maculata]|uniref:Uncharacterized protein n=1 Tax=Mycena maculata TaxID=230809 RepID=A0AAD7H9C0_9AGAR|nr:hypothetical protein DFH07DRAFT_785697 [Mycena maculata]